MREFATSPALALAALADVLAPETVLFFEEVQHLRDAPLFLKGLVDLDRTRRLVATGSSSFELGARTRESLAGRARRTRLLPLSLEEAGALVPAELAKRLDLLDEIHFWRSKSGAEIDFVVRRGERTVAIEVKAAEIVRPTLSRGTRSFLEAYRPACFGVVNASLRLDTVEDGVPVRFVRPWELDLVLAHGQAENPKEKLGAA